MENNDYSDVMILAKDVDLKGGWDTFWGAVSAPLSDLVNLLTVIGALLVIGSIIVYFWRRRRGGDTPAPLMWTLLVGAILCAPDAILPLFLGLLDAIANAGIALFKRVV